MRVTVQDAAQRRVVRFAGRTGRLVSVPVEGSGNRHGAMAVVQLPSGAHLSVPVDDIEVVE